MDPYSIAIFAELGDRCFPGVGRYSYNSKSGSVWEVVNTDMQSQP